MRGHDREELGAHVLGLLDAGGARAVEAHLAVCGPCRQEWEELCAMAELLDDVPPEALLEGIVKLQEMIGTESLKERYALRDERHPIVVLQPPGAFDQHLRAVRMP